MHSECGCWGYEPWAVTPYSIGKYVNSCSFSIKAERPPDRRNYPMALAVAAPTTKTQLMNFINTVLFIYCRLVYAAWVCEWSRAFFFYLIFDADAWAWAAIGVASKYGN